VTRGVGDLLADLAEAADAAAELLSLGKDRWDAERPLRLAGEAVISRLGDIASKLPDDVVAATPEIPWREVKGMRDHRGARLPPHRLRRGVGDATRRRPEAGQRDWALAPEPGLIMPDVCPTGAERSCAAARFPSSSAIFCIAGRLDS